MFKVATILLSASLCSLSVLAEDSIIRLSSQHSVSKTADQFVTTIQEKGFNVFARVDHKANAEKVGMELRPTQVVILVTRKLVQS